MCTSLLDVCFNYNFSKMQPSPYNKYLFTSHNPIKKKRSSKFFGNVLHFLGNSSKFLMLSQKKNAFFLVNFNWIIVSKNKMRLILQTGILRKRKVGLFHRKHV